jgi:4-hydroxy-2-oxoheptanedioate aldolase
MRPNPLFDHLRAGKVALGLCNMYPASGIIEGMCPGWDFVWIDGQHGEMDYAACLHAVQAARGAGVETLIRVPGHDHRDLGTLADLGPSALMVPMVDSPEQAELIVQGTRFPPRGNRSYGARRAIDLDGREYYQRELMVVAQIETLEAVDAAAEIAAVDGIDALFFGPDDMKLRMGIPVNTPVTDHPRLREALAQTAAAAAAAGIFAGTVAPSAAAAEMVTELGYRILVGGGDIAFLRALAAGRLDELRSATDSAQTSNDDGGSSGVY